MKQTGFWINIIWSSYKLLPRPVHYTKSFHTDWSSRTGFLGLQQDFHQGSNQRAKKVKGINIIITRKMLIKHIFEKLGTLWRQLFGIQTLGRLTSLNVSLSQPMGAAVLQGEQVDGYPTVTPIGKHRVRCSSCFSCVSSGFLWGVGTEARRR